MLVFYRALRRVEDIPAAARFLLNSELTLPRSQRLALVGQLGLLTCVVECGHDQHEMLAVIESILSTPARIEGCIVEAGSFKGGSAAKFSLAAKLTGRPLFIFDSFEGLPENEESWEPGRYCGSLEEVQHNIRQFGELDVCEFVKGWFEHTMPCFNQPIIIAYIDVDLADSTRTCLRYLYPLLVPGGALYSQDGHLPLVIDVFNDVDFWENDVGCPRPAIEGLGRHRLSKIVKLA